MNKLILMQKTAQHTKLLHQANILGVPGSCLTVPIPLYIFSLSKRRQREIQHQNCVGI